MLSSSGLLKKFINKSGVLKNSMVNNFYIKFWKLWGTFGTGAMGMIFLRYNLQW